MNSIFKPSDMDIILSALTLKQYRPFNKLYKSLPEDRKHLHDDIFGNKDRIYLDEKIIFNTTENANISHQIHMINFITSMLNAYLHKKPSEMFSSLEDDDYESYMKGYVKNAKGKEFSIGKLIAKFEKLDTNTADKYIAIAINEMKPKLEAFKKAFNDRGSSKFIDKNLIVCISRHPYDVAGMSTDQKWTSCMRLPDYLPPAETSDMLSDYYNTYDDENGDNETEDLGGEYHYKLFQDVKFGTCVAYLIDEKDKNINNALARIAIKPFYGEINTGTIYKDETKTIVVLIPEDNMYHDNSLTTPIYDKFKSIVYNWCDEVNTKRTDNKSGLFFDKPDELYDDSHKSTYISGGNVDFDYIKNFYTNVFQIGNEEQYLRFIKLYDTVQRQLLNLSTEDYQEWYSKIRKGLTKKTITIELVNDIIFNDYKNYQIKKCDFVLNGNGHSIIFNTTGKRYLFREISALGAIKNCTFSGNLHRCGIIDVNYGNITNCINRCTVFNDYEIAVGFVRTNYLTISDCVNYGNIRGDYAGGIVGENAGRRAVIMNCTNYGTIIGDDQAAGICIEMDPSVSKIINCFNKGVIKGTDPDTQIAEIYIPSEENIEDEEEDYTLLTNEEN